MNQTGTKSNYLALTASYLNEKMLAQKLRYVYVIQDPSMEREQLTHEYYNI
jgi:hypothetical protein